MTKFLEIALYAAMVFTFIAVPIILYVRNGA